MPIDRLQHLDLADLLSGPLVAAIDASVTAQTETIRLLREVGYDRDGSLQTVSFGYETQAVDPETGEATRERRRLDVPLLLFLSLPNLQVSQIEEEFSARITQVESLEEETTGRDPFATNRLIVSPAERSTTLDRTTRSRFHLDVRMVAERQNESVGMELLERAANNAVTERRELDRRDFDRAGEPVARPETVRDLRSASRASVARASDEEVEEE